MAKRPLADTSDAPGLQLFFMVQPALAPSLLPKKLPYRLAQFPVLTRYVPSYLA